MKSFVLALLFSVLTASGPSWAEAEFDVTYWDTAEGKILQSRIPKKADYWQLIPTFAVQTTQSYCSVASAITVLNAMPIQKPVDPTYAPYAFFTQTNFFTPEVTKIISAETVLQLGMTRDEMAATLTAQGVNARSIAGDSFNSDDLRTLLQYTLGDDGQFVLVNYYRTSLGQVGGGHWSVLAAYDVETDSVLILDVAKYKYPPVWVGTSALRTAISTLDTTSNKPRGLVIVSKE